MEFKKNIPIYLQIMDKLKQDISLKILNPGDKLMYTGNWNQKILFLQKEGREHLL